MVTDMEEKQIVTQKERRYGDREGETNSVL